MPSKEWMLCTDGIAVGHGPRPQTDSPGTLAFRNDLRQVREQPKLFHRFIYFDDDEEERRWIERHLPR